MSAPLLRRFRALGTRGAVLLCLASSPAAGQEGSTYQNAVHIDSNAGTVTIQSKNTYNNNNTYNTYNTYPVQPGVTEQAIRQLLDAAQQKAGARWQASFKKALESLNAQAEARHTETITKLTAMDAKVTQLGPEIEAALAQKSDEGEKRAAALKRELDDVKAQVQQIQERLQEKKPPKPDYTWWVVGGAVLVVGGLVTAYLVTRPAQEHPITPGTLGIVHLRLGQP